MYTSSRETSTHCLTDVGTTPGQCGLVSDTPSNHFLSRNAAKFKKCSRGRGSGLLEVSKTEFFVSLDIHQWEEPMLSGEGQVSCRPLHAQAVGSKVYPPLIHQLLHHKKLPKQPALIMSCMRSYIPA
ncbi:hypothetical protein J6590_041400 [Homalodisca vitripennis]|nr:hypothetical protein J6590_041400 [Homalodisca vitripennis]